MLNLVGYYDTYISLCIYLPWCTRNPTDETNSKRSWMENKSAQERQTELKRGSIKRPSPPSLFFLSWKKVGGDVCIHVCSSADHKSENVNSIFHHHHHHPSCLIFFSFPSANKEMKRGGQWFFLLTYPFSWLLIILLFSCLSKNCHQGLQSSMLKIT